MGVDAVQLLMIEHLQCKSMKALQDISQDHDRFVTFHEFLLNVHIEVEEKVVFPALSQPLWDDSRSYAKRVKQIAADHKLLDKLAKNLIRWKESGNEEIYGERIPLYYRLLVDHNQREETDLFGRWKEIDKSVYRTSEKEIYNIISSFGTERYRQAMNISESAFRYIVRGINDL